MNPAVAILSALFSVLMPQKMWYSVQQPINVTVNSDKDVTLVLTEFAGGKVVDPTGTASPDVAAGKTVDVKAIYPGAGQPGTYVLYATTRGSKLPTSGPPTQFLGTPVVIEVLVDKRRDAPPGPMVIHVVPLQYVVMDTEAGKITEVFYYDEAPHTAGSFINLAEEGFYDGVIFHRVVPGFVIQGGDPLGTGSGGPNYHLDQEFNDKAHKEGVLSMARNGDPSEDPASGRMPGYQAANSAGSQFFICLDYKNTQQLDRRYTAFGQVTDGMDAVKQIAAGKIADAATGRPEKPVAITKAQVFAVTAEKNPYSALWTPPPVEGHK